jgi:hypothetical protein
MNYMLEHIRRNKESQASGLVNPRQELNEYLAEAVRYSGVDIIKWWAVSTFISHPHSFYPLLTMVQRHKNRFPTLARMAKDYLAIPASSTDSERVFSRAGLIGTNRRSRLHEANFEALQVLRSAYSNDLINVNEMIRERTRLSLKK